MFGLGDDLRSPRIMSDGSCCVEFGRFIPPKIPPISTQSKLPNRDVRDPSRKREPAGSGVSFSQSHGLMPTLRLTKPLTQMHAHMHLVEIP